MGPSLWRDDKTKTIEITQMHLPLRQQWVGLMGDKDLRDVGYLDGSKVSWRWFVGDRRDVGFSLVDHAERHRAVCGYHTKVEPSVDNRAKWPVKHPLDRCSPCSQSH